MFISQLRLGSTFSIPYMPGHIWTLTDVRYPYHFWFTDQFGLTASSGCLLEVELISDNVSVGFAESNIQQLTLF